MSQARQSVMGIRPMMFGSRINQIDHSPCTDAQLFSCVHDFVYYYYCGFVPCSPSNSTFSCFLRRGVHSRLHIFSCPGIDTRVQGGNIRFIQRTKKTDLPKVTSEAVSDGNRTHDVRITKLTPGRINQLGQGWGQGCWSFNTYSGTHLYSWVGRSKQVICSGILGNSMSSSEIWTHNLQVIMGPSP
jgi:hypothetical protein